MFDGYTWPLDISLCPTTLIKPSDIRRSSDLCYFHCSVPLFFLENSFEDDDDHDHDEDNNGLGVRHSKLAFKSSFPWPEATFSDQCMITR